MRAIYRVAKATFHEAWRRRFLNGILVFALLIIGSSWVFAYLQPGAELKMIIDVSLGSIRFFGMLIAVFMGTRLIPDEIEKRTIHTILTKPVSRAQFLYGKLLGGVATIFTNVALMGAAFFVVFALKAPQFRNMTTEGAMSMEFMAGNIMKAVVLSFFELTVLMSIAVAASTIFSWIIASIFSFFVYFVGQMAEFFNQLANPDRDIPALAKMILATIYRLLPHFEIFDIREAIMKDQFVPFMMLGKIIAQGLSYAVIVMLIGYLFFNEREV
jgi:ABC-type transport system involved in multi-copper enzyme maturation permease subunit